LSKGRLLQDKIAPNKCHLFDMRYSVFNIQSCQKHVNIVPFSDVGFFYTMSVRSLYIINAPINCMDYFQVIV